MCHVGDRLVVLCVMSVEDWRRCVSCRRKAGDVMRHVSEWLAVLCVMSVKGWRRCVSCR